MKLLSHYLTSIIFLATTTTLRSLALSIPAHLTKPITKHAWVQIPQGWEEHTSVPSADQPITLRIALKQSGIEELVSALYEVSDPESEKYGRHLSRIEVERLVAPHPSSLDILTSWLSSHSILPSSLSPASPASDWVQLTVPLSTASELLSATYRTYQHTDSGELVVRTLEYSLPRALHEHVDLVMPTTVFGRMGVGRGMRSMVHVNSRAGEEEEVGATETETADTPDVTGPAGQMIAASCNTTITPSCLMQLYRTEGYVPQAADKGNRIGITGYLEQFVNFADLQTFFSQFRPDALGANVTVLSVNGGLNDQSTPGVEAGLDNQYTEGLTFPTPNIYYTTPGTAPTINDSVTPPQRDEPYIDWMNFVLSHDDMPQVFTTSYGGDEQTFPKEFAVRACNMFAQLGARGASVIFSSGDGGVGAGTCETNDGTNRVLFQPVFPATCPFVTGVGATFHIAPERGIGFSQGGFSVYFPRPSYQNIAVPPFLRKLGNTYAGLFTPTGRAVPDVSAQGEGFQVIVGGRVESVGGTSASSPTFASIVALLNDFRISRGKPSLGFLNPVLYSKGLPGFVDILLGNNPGCGTPGFNATEGWDAVTGLGTPDFVKLKALLG